MWFGVLTGTNRKFIRNVCKNNVIFVTLDLEDRSNLFEISRKVRLADNSRNFYQVSGT